MTPKDPWRAALWGVALLEEGASLGWALRSLKFRRGLECQCLCLLPVDLDVELLALQHHACLHASPHEDNGFSFIRGATIMAALVTIEALRQVAS